MSNYKIEDNSGDKKYFTIIPNYIYNHSTLYDREVYCQMKRITGEDGTCWMSQNNLAKQCGISINRLKKSIKYLVEHKWIKYNGKKIIKTIGGTQEVNKYSISDLWKINNDFYNKGVSPDDIPLEQGVSPDDARGITNEPKGVSPDDIPLEQGVSPDDARGITNEPKGVSPDDDKEELYNNNNEEEQLSISKEIEVNKKREKLKKNFSFNCKDYE